MEHAQTHSLAVIEDAAQAHGADYKCKKAGSIGDYGCFSFYNNKNMGTYGDAGILVLDDAQKTEELDNMMEFRGELSGTELLKNTRFPIMLAMSHAAVLNVKLKYLDRFNIIRRKMAESYNKQLAGLDLALPQPSTDGKDVYFMYTIRTTKRDRLKQFLESKNIPTAVDYRTPLHLHPTYKELGYKRGDFPEAEKACDEVLSLPINPFLKPEELSEVTSAIKEFFR